MATTARETELKRIRARVIQSLGGWDAINRPVEYPACIQPHICGASGYGCYCPACEVVRENQESR